MLQSFTTGNDLFEEAFLQIFVRKVILVDGEGLKTVISGQRLLEELFICL